MPRDSATTFGDLSGKLDVLRAVCEKCGYAERYQLGRLIQRNGPDGNVLDFSTEISAGCPLRMADNFYDPCAVNYPDLPRVL